MERKGQSMTTLHNQPGRLRFAALVVLAVAAAFAVTVASAAPLGGRATVKAHSSSLGKILVDAKGHTLYLFAKDKRSKSACSGQCATYWPPLLTGGKPIARTGAKASLLGMTRRSDGKMQVTYAGHPLYRFALDTKAGQTKGEGLDDFGGEWDAVTPSGKNAEKHD
jgi:predicted lipoprotein with Yx(FWY)xxD motif